MSRLNITSLGVLALLLITSCQSKPEQETTQTTVNGDNQVIEKTVIPEFGSQSGDTLNLHGKFICFFHPKADSILAKDSLVMFEGLTRSVVDSISIHLPGVPVVVTSSGALRIYNKTTGRPMVILAWSLDNRYGMVLSDGLQSPVIRKGVLSTDEYLTIIRRYFMVAS
jgi:hypothetical protein